MTLQDQKRYGHISLHAEAQNSGSSLLAFPSQSVSLPRMWDVLKVYGLTCNHLWRHLRLLRRDFLPHHDVQAGKIVEKRDRSHHHPLISIVCFLFRLDRKFHSSLLYSRLLKFIAITWWSWLVVLPSWRRKSVRRLRFWWIAKSEVHRAWVFIVPSGILRLVKTACSSVWKHSWTFFHLMNRSSKTVRTTMKINESKGFE